MTPMLYRRRPILVEAIQVNATDWDGAEYIADWCHGSLLDLDHFLLSGDSAVLYLPGHPDPAGGCYVEDGQWVVRLGGNRFVAVDDKTFLADFEPVVTL